MTLNKNLLARFLDLVSLKGDAEIKEINFDITKDSLNVNANNLIKTCMVRAKLNNDFTDLVKLKSFGLLDINLLKKLICTIKDDNIDISYDKNKLIITQPRLTAKLSIVDRVYISTQTPDNKFDEILQTIDNQAFTIDAEGIKDILINYYCVFNEDLVLISNKNNISINLAKNENEIILNLNEYVSINKVKDFKVKFGKVLVDVLSTIKNTIDIRVDTDKPIYIKYTEDNIIAEYLVAPIIQEM